MNRNGIQKALLAAALFGLSAPLAKGLLATARPQTLAGLLYLGSGTGLLLVWLRTRRGTHAEKPLARVDLPWLAGAIASGGVLGPVLLLFGLASTPASTSSLLLNLEAVFTAVIAWLAFGENADRRIVLGMFAIVLGGALLSWQGGVDRAGVLGPLAVVIATLCWGIDNNLTQRLSSGDPIQIAMVKGLVAGTVNLTIGLALGDRITSAATVGAAMTLGFFSYGVSLVLFVLALRDLGTARTGAYFSLAPFIGAVGSLLIWREAVTPLFAAGGSLMALGLVIHLTERHEHSHVHEPLTHFHSHVHDEHHRHNHAPVDPPGEPHTHVHAHEQLEHTHAHYPEVHHRHPH